MLNTNKLTKLIDSSSGTLIKTRHTNTALSYVGYIPLCERPGESTISQADTLKGAKYLVSDFLPHASYYSPLFRKFRLPRAFSTSSFLCLAQRGGSWGVVRAKARAAVCVPLRLEHTNPGTASPLFSQSREPRLLGYRLVQDVQI